MKFRYLDFAAFAPVLAGFLFVASERLGIVPVPEGDEAYLLQVSYEMVYHNKVAVPMMRYLGGNIENAWHSRTPFYFLLMREFHKLFGFGILQGRAFNLVTAALTLLMVYVLARRMFDWQAALISVILLVGDPVFFERSRLLRNDFAAAAFALLAFYLYELAQHQKNAKYYIASGLTAGLGVMCHINIVYMVGTIGLLILVREGWGALRSSKLYLFAGSAIVVVAYEIIYAVVDYKNFMLQNRGDEVHFRVLTRGGLWQNLMEERLRYLKWYAGGLMFPNVPQATLRIFQLLAVAAIIYLLIRFARGIRRGKVFNDPRARLLVVIAVVVVFHALMVSQKRVFYLAHIVPWLAIATGATLRDALDRITKLRTAEWERARLAYNAAAALVALSVLGYMFQLVAEGRRYLAEVRNPNLASFEEFTTVIREIVPEGLCPVALKNPSVWLAFPERDGCFASIENRIKEEAYADIEGKDYALVTRLNALPDKRRDSDSSDNRPDAFRLLGEMRDTPYGNLVVYYTGSDRRYLALAPKRYQFNGELRGHSTISE